MANEPIRASKGQGLIDGIQAASRYAIVLVTFTTALLGLLKVKDISGMIALIQSNGGEVLAAISGLIALGVAGYGVFKSHKRGDQVETVATDPEVPEEVAQLK